MSRESDPVNEHGTAPASGYSKRGNKKATPTAISVSAETEKKRKRTKHRKPRDTEDAKPESKHKRRKKDKGEKLRSAEKGKDGRPSEENNRKSDGGANGTADKPSHERTGDSGDTGDTGMNGWLPEGNGNVNEKKSTAADGKDKTPTKKGRKEKKPTKSSKEESEDTEETTQLTREKQTSDDTDDTPKKSRNKKEKKKKRESSSRPKKRKFTEDGNAFETSQTPDDAPPAIANGTCATSSHPVGTTTNEEEQPVTTADGAVQVEVAHNAQNALHKHQTESEERKPSVSDFLKQASQKRLGYLHGAPAIPLLSVEQVRSLDNNQRHDYVKKSAALCHQLVHLMHEIIVTANAWIKIERSGDLVDVEEALTRDMARFSTFPIAKQYVSMTLWRRIEQMTRDHLLASSKIGFGKGIAKQERGEDQGFVLHLEDDPDAEFVSYKDAYMANLVEQHQGCLDTLREREEMDETRVRFLLRCLDAGSSLAANLKCIEKNIEHQEIEHGGTDTIDRKS